MNKKIIGIVAAVILAGAPALALARTIPVSGGTVDCSSSIYTDANTSATSSASQSQLIGCAASNGSPENVVFAFGGTNSSWPHVQPGATIHDAAGIEFLCPSFVTPYCVDITGSDWYKMSARTIAKQGGGAGKYHYWLNN